MVQSPERRWLRLLLGYLLFVGILVLAMTPIYFYAAPSHRPTVVRLGAVLFLGIALIHLRKLAREWLDAQPPSAFEAALHRAPPEPRIAPLFVKLRDEVRFSARSQAYFANVLWPRILRLLAARTGQPLAAAPAMPDGRHLLRRGPSLTTLQDLIARIEERP
jgi:hypothetical protein